MMGISTVRIIRAAWQNFWRNIWLSLATMMVMIITLIMISFLYFANIFGAEVLRGIEKRVDLSVTFKHEVEKNQIDAFAAEMQSRSDVESIRIISSEQALELFKEHNKNEPSIEESLKLLEDNPLSASMFIVATDPTRYERIAQDLQQEQYKAIIEEVNLEQSRLVIDRLIAITTMVRNIGLVVTIVFSLLVILIMFNTVRLAIYSFREEIDIMRLVGASRWFIQGPFILESVFIVLVAVMIATALLYTATQALTNPLQFYFFDQGTEKFDLHAYAVSHWINIIGLQIIFGTSLAVFSTMIGIRRYLKR